MPGRVDDDGVPTRRALECEVQGSPGFNELKDRDRRINRDGSGDIDELGCEQPDPADDQGYEAPDETDDPWAFKWIGEQSLESAA